MRNEYFLKQFSIKSLNMSTEAALHRCFYKANMEQIIICSKFTGEHLYQSVVSIKLLCSFIEIILWHGYSPENL